MGSRRYGAPRSGPRGWVLNRRTGRRLFCTYHREGCLNRGNCPHHLLSHHLLSCTRCRFRRLRTVGRNGLCRNPYFLGRGSSKGIQTLSTALQNNHNSGAAASRRRRSRRGSGPRALRRPLRVQHASPRPRRRRRRSPRREATDAKTTGAPLRRPARGNRKYEFDEGQVEYISAQPRTRAVLPLPARRSSARQRTARGWAAIRRTSPPGFSGQCI